MRTTIDIDDPVLKDLKRLQKTTGQSLGRLASELLAQALALQGQPRPAPTLTWISRQLGALVNIDDKEAVRQAMDAAP